MTDHINGAFTFVLHSHLPYARQAGMWPHGEEWVHEITSNMHGSDEDKVPEAGVSYYGRNANVAPPELWCVGNGLSPG